MKARIKSNGKIVEVVSRFMPKKRNVPSRDWVCNLSDGTCIDENQLEYINATECLEEAAEEYRRESFKKAVMPQIDGPVSEYGGSIKDAFIAGAEWQKNQMPMPEDTVLFNKGVAEGRRLERDDMMKDAVEAKVVGFDILNRTILLTNIPTDLNMDDKVRIIVLKEEE